MEQLIHTHRLETDNLRKFFRDLSERELSTFEVSWIHKGSWESYWEWIDRGAEVDLETERITQKVIFDRKKFYNLDTALEGEPVYGVLGEEADYILDGVKATVELYFCMNPVKPYTLELYKLNVIGFIKREWDAKRNEYIERGLHSNVCGSSRLDEWCANRKEWKDYESNRHKSWALNQLIGLAKGVVIAASLIGSIGYAQNKNYMPIVYIAALNVLALSTGLYKVEVESPTEPSQKLYLSQEVFKKGLSQ